MNNKYTFEEAIKSYKARSPVAQQLLRRIAAQRLICHGFEEVGSSDVNHELCHMYNEYQGDWDQCYLDALEDYAGI